MNRKFRLSKTTDFQRVRKYGKSYPHSLVIMIVFPNQSNEIRVGVTAGRSIGNAVKRNRAKRLIRAAINPLLGFIEPGWDFILIARKPILDVKSPEVQKAIIILLRKSKILSIEHLPDL